MTTDKTQAWGSEKISKILLKLAPPVMLAQLIQALYNIVDSLFVGKYSESGLTALSIVYPLQLLMIAFAVGTGVGINTIVAARLGKGDKKEADGYAGMAAPLAILLWILFALIFCLTLPFLREFPRSPNRSSTTWWFTAGSSACSASDCSSKAAGRKFCRPTGT